MKNFKVIKNIKNEFAPTIGKVYVNGKVELIGNPRTAEVNGRSFAIDHKNDEVVVEISSI